MGCTGIKLLTKDNEVYWGRTQDFELNFDYKGVKISRNYYLETMFTPYKTKYAVMGIGWAEKSVKKHPVLLDGINEYGLVGGSFYFGNFHKYKETEEILKNKKTPLRGEEITTWILTNYKDIDEVIKKLNKDVAVTNAAGPMMNKSMPQHFMFQDKSGRSIVVEPTLEEGFEIYENKIGVFTNSPDFKWHLTNLKTHLEKSSERKYKYTIDEEIESIDDSEFNNGLCSIPSDFMPETRFLRASYNKLLSKEIERDDALIQLIQLLSTVNNPKGSLRLMSEGKLVKPWTQFTVLHDVSNMDMYVYFYENRTLQKLKFHSNDDNKEEITFYEFHKNEVILEMKKI